MGYSYKDKYGISHTVSSESTAKQYAASGSGITNTGTGTTSKSSIVPSTSTSSKSSSSSSSAGVGSAIGGKSSSTSNNDTLADLSNLWYQQTAAGDTAGAELTHQQANALRNSLGLLPGVDYDLASSASLIPSTSVATTQQPDQLSQIMALLQQPTPTYEQPDYSDLIPAATQGVAATANAADTYFTPTKSYNDRVATIKANADEQAYKTYTSNLSARNNQISSLLSMLPYTTMTAAQQVTSDQQKAADKLSQLTKEGQLEQDKITNDLKQRQLDLEEMRTTYDINKPYYNPYSGGGSSGGGLTSYQQSTLSSNAAKSEQAIRDQAVALAVKDPDYYSQTQEGQNTIIGRYYERLKSLNY
jgi:hypothetical protein